MKEDKYGNIYDDEQEPEEQYEPTQEEIEECDRHRTEEYWNRRNY